jgi:hypothetical protein
MLFESGHGNLARLSRRFGRLLQRGEEIGLVSQARHIQSCRGAQMLCNGGGCCFVEPPAIFALDFRIHLRDIIARGLGAAAIRGLGRSAIASIARGAVGL